MSATGNYFYGNWYGHENDPVMAGDAWLVNGATMSPYDVGTPDAEIGPTPDMLFGTPDEADDFVALKINAGVTEVYRNSVSAYLSTVPRVCYFGKAYPTLVDGRVLAVLGRATDGNRATAGQPELIYYSEDSCQSWIEKGQSMLAGFGVTGITGAHADWSSD